MATEGVIGKSCIATGNVWFYHDVRLAIIKMLSFVNLSFFFSWLSTSLLGKEKNNYPLLKQSKGANECN